jgi:transcriptional regulator with XRE-family HTH domain
LSSVINKNIEKMFIILYNVVRKEVLLMTLGEVVKAYRAEHKLSMDNFAKLSELSKGYISMLEKNRNPRTGKPIVPSIDTYTGVAKAMNISIEDLMRLVGSEQLVSIVPSTKDETAASSSSSPQLSKDDQALLHAFHNASEEAKGMVRFALRPTWPKDIDQFVDKVAEGEVAKATKDKVKEAMAEGKSIVIPSKPNKKLPQLPEGFTAVKTRLHTRVTPTMSTHCKAIFRSINAEAFDDEDIRKKLDSYRETLMDKNVATFISNTMDLLEERFSMVDESRVYAIIAEEVLKDDFVERYVSFGQQGVEKLIKRLRNRFR